VLFTYLNDLIICFSGEKPDFSVFDEEIMNVILKAL
jgi:hypothetical protein